MSYADMTTALVTLRSELRNLHPESGAHADQGRAVAKQDTNFGRRTARACDT